MTERSIRRLGIAALLFASTAPVFAADLPTKAPVAPVVPTYDWTGVYIGVNLGYSVGRNPIQATEGIFAASEAFGLQPAGVIGGAQIGYNWQFAPHWVTGIEADFQGADQRDNVCVTRCLPAVAQLIEQRMPWFGTLRGRFGYANGPLLLYATAGLAYGREETTSTVIDPPAASQTNAFAHTKTGWAAGGGIEGAIGGNWTAKAEYLHVDLGSATDTFNFAGPFIVIANTQYFRDNIFRFGVNYRFGAPQAYAAYAPMPTKAPVAPYSWNGVYAGINLGYGVARNPTSYIATGFVPQGNQFNLDPAGVLGGAQIGVNWQFGQWVLGLETDIQDQSSNVAPSPNCITSCSPGQTVLVDQHLRWLGTARVRAGWANGPLLFYATGGAAYGSVETSASTTTGIFVPPFTSVTGVTTKSTKVGWTAGGGIEGQLMGNWTAKGEYLYVDLGSQSGSYATDFGLGFIQNATITSSVREHIFRLGLNYKFFER